jgi:putative transposase
VGVKIQMPKRGQDSRAVDTAPTPILKVYLHHFNTARPHRTLAQLTPTQTETDPPRMINLASYQLHRRAILDGLTSEYQIAA